MLVGRLSLSNQDVVTAAYLGAEAITQLRRCASVVRGIYQRWQDGHCCGFECPQREILHNTDPSLLLSTEDLTQNCDKIF